MNRGPERIEMNNYHTSVLLKETIEALHIQSGHHYIDATLGGGGHTLEILKQGGKVLAIDQDEDAIAYVTNEFKTQNVTFKIGEDVLLVKGNFNEIDILAKEYGFANVSGILLDLGVSGHQLDTAERGFSFRYDAMLDMRMDRSLAVTAKDLIHALSVGELQKLFEKFGEETFANRIAKAIVQSRGVTPIDTTKQLAEIIAHVVPGHGSVHPATRVFQALRIAVNDELHNLEEAMPKALSLLEKKGRLVIITFHSLEDRIVKNAFIAFEKEHKGLIVVKKPISAQEEEIIKNNRSRSAKLRVIEKI